MPNISETLARQNQQATLDYTLRQQNGVYTDRVYAADAANAITIVTALQIFSYLDGATVRVKAFADNTGAMSIKVDDNAFVPIKTESGASVAAGEIKEGDIIFLVYDASNSWFTYRTEAADISALDARLDAAEIAIGTNTADIAALSVEIDTKANDADVVKLTGNQNVSGVKAFANSPTVPTPTSASQATNKDYVDSAVAGFVDTTNPQTINGVKTFTTLPKGPAVNPTLNEELANKQYVDTVLAGAVLGDVPDNSLEEIKQHPSVKTGQLASLTTTIKTTFAAAINELNALKAKLTGGNNFVGTQTIESGEQVFYNPSGTANKRKFAIGGAVSTLVISAKNDLDAVIRILLELVHDGGVKIYGTLTIAAGSIYQDNGTGIIGKTVGGVAKALLVLSGDDKVYVGAASQPMVLEGSSFTAGGNRISVDTGWKTATVLTSAWGVAGTGPDGKGLAAAVTEASCAVGDVIDVEIGYAPNISSYKAAVVAGVDRYVESAAGVFFLWAASVPSQNLAIKYRVNKG